MRQVILTAAMVGLTAAVTTAQVTFDPPQAVGVREALELPHERPTAEVVTDQPSTLRSAKLNRPEKTHGPAYFSALGDGSAMWVGGYIQPAGPVHEGYTTFVQWDLDRLEVRKMTSIISAPPKAWAISQDGSRAVLCTLNPDKRGESRVHFVDLTKGAELAPAWVVQADIEHLSIIPAGSGAGVWDGERLRLFQVARGLEVAAIELPLQHYQVTAITSSSGNDLRVALSDGRVLVIADGAFSRETRVHRGAVIALADDARTMVTSGIDGMLVIWEKREDRARHQLEAPPGGVRQLVISPDGRLVAGISRSGAHVWRIFDGAVAMQVPIQGNVAHAVTFDAGSSKLRILSGEGLMQEHAIKP